MDKIVVVTAVIFSLSTLGSLEALQAQSGDSKACKPLAGLHAASQPFEELKRGGYLIVLRHAEDNARTDRPCLDQHRAINRAEGALEKIRMVGRSLAHMKFDRRDIMVYSSHHCRAIETAEEVRAEYVGNIDLTLEMAIKNMPIERLGTLNDASKSVAPKQWRKTISIIRSKLAASDRDLVTTGGKRRNIIAVTHSGMLDNCDPHHGGGNGFENLEAMVIDLDCYDDTREFMCPPDGALLIGSRGKVNWTDLASGLE